MDRAAAPEPMVDYLEGLMEGFVAYDGDWRMTYMNAAAEAILGRRRADVVGKTWQQAFPHAVGNDVDRMYQRVKARRVPERLEFFYAHYGRWMEISASPLANGGVAVYFRDISDRMLAEGALRESEERLRLAQGYGGIGVWSWRSSTRGFRAEPEMESLYGVPPGSFASYEDWVSRVHPQDRARVEAERDRALAAREPFSLEYRILHASGEVRWIMAKGRGEYDDSGALVRTLGVNVDITERKRAEESRRQSEERLAKAFAASPSGLVISGEKDGIIREVNDSFLRLLGLKREEVIGRTGAELQLFSRPEDRETALAALRREGRLRDYEMQVRTRAGELRTVLLAVEILELGEERSLLTIVRDATEQKRMEEALREADRRKNQFLATLAHELRNPLAPILNAVSLLRLQGPRDPALDSARDIVERQLSLMVRLIDDLMDASRITRGKLELRRSRVPLAMVVEQALETCRPHLGHELTVALPHEPLYVDADPVRLAQVFSNLLNNACKYTERGGRISLSGTAEGGEVLVRVKDNGIGIPREHLPHLFEMFSQAPSALGRAEGGLGIGLSLARSLVELHGGTLTAHSEGPGQGSEFSVRLPLAATPAEPPAPEAAGGRLPGARRVLVADDNSDAANSLALLLRATGNEVETAGDGLEALQRAERFRPDLVLLDLGMPRLDGYATCRRLRELPWGREVLAVALTGWGQEEDRRRSKEAGFDAHVVKPLDYAVLARLLAARRRSELSL